MGGSTAGANSETSQRRAQAKERQRLALDYRIGGLTFEQIGDKLGITRQGAHGLVRRALVWLNKDIAQSAGDLKAVESARLDTMQAALWGDVLKGDLSAIDRAIKIATRRAALLGLDAPTKIAPTNLAGDASYECLSDDERAQRILAILEAARARSTEQTAEHQPAP